MIASVPCNSLSYSGGLSNVGQAAPWNLVLQVIILMELFMLASIFAQHVHVRLLLDPLLAVSLRHGDGRDSLDILHCADHHGVGLGEGAGGAVGFPGPVLVLGILCQVLVWFSGARS